MSWELRNYRMLISEQFLKTKVLKAGKDILQMVTGRIFRILLKPSAFIQYWSAISWHNEQNLRHWNI
jgi:hypothetical protein